MPNPTRSFTSAVFLLLGCALMAAGGARANEQEYFSELPVVLSVSRLAQPLNEAPGAVTVLDRETIRRSGARTIAEVLRLVPGFMVGYFLGGARPVANYHADVNDIPRHLQVFVDGRSTFSSLVLGTAGYGMLAVDLEDVERIEVLRGSNSAAYGANAFLGVVNVITRHAADSTGGAVAMRLGEGGLRDSAVRVGWGDERAAFRVSAAQRVDEGFGRLHDASRMRQMHFRGDFSPRASDDLHLAGGQADFRWQVPEVPSREEAWRNAYVQAQWTRRLEDDATVKLRAQIDTEAFGNFHPSALRADGHARRIELEGEHSFVAGSEWRFVWGGQYRHEQVKSADIFYDEPIQEFGLRRLFGNIEWRPHPQWLINAGGLWEDHGISGPVSAPRLMVNFHAAPGHTIRVGTTESHKQPTLFELRADWRNGVTPVIAATGKARPERIRATELGYLGDFRALRLHVDLRGFIEETRDVLRFFRFCGGCPNDVANKDPNTQRGWEAQLRWQPWDGTRVLFNHTQLRLVPDAASTTHQDRFRAPRHYSTLALFQRLPGDWDVSVIHVASEAYFTVRLDDLIPAYRQTDLRLARAFRWGRTKGELSLAARAVTGGHVAYVVRNVPPIVLDRRVDLGLRLEF